jgi:phosphatidylglycerophosphate synthase
MMPELAARRPLKSRGTRWAAALARALARSGLRPNQVSVLSVVFAMAAAGLLAASGQPPAWWQWLLAALAIQLRLLCNLLDGMLAVEGGMRTPTGDLFNEFPDRLADLLILAALGHAGGDEFCRTLGWLCACGALITAALRLHGAGLTGIHDFRGPLAKPQRMALATATCLAMAALAFGGAPIGLVPWALGLMLAGIAMTIIRRLRALAVELRRRAGSPAP